MPIEIQQIILETLQTCQKHQQRMNYAKAKIKHLFPLNESAYCGLTNDDVAYIDHFVERFSKLQDAMGARLFPQMLELTQEQTSGLAFIDKLNRLEKIGAISDASKWLELRGLRNSFAHDYPSDIVLNVQTLNQTFLESLSLEFFLSSCVSFIHKYSSPEKIHRS